MCIVIIWYVALEKHQYFDSIMQHKLVHMQINQYTEYAVALKN